MKTRGEYMPNVRSTGVAGIGFVAAVVAAIVVTGAVPDASRPLAEMAAYITEHRAAVLTAAWLGFPIVALFMLFATGVCDHVAALDPREGTSLRWAWAGALLSSAALLVASAIQGALAYDGAPAPILRFGFDLYNLTLSIGSLTPWGWFIFALTRSASRSAAFATSLIGFGYVAAATNWLLSFSLFFRSGPLVPGGSAFFLYVVGLLWTVSISVVLLRSPR